MSPEKSYLEKCSAVIWTSLSPKVEVPVQKLLPMVTRFIILGSCGTLILALLHCCSFLLYICIKIYTGRIVILQNPVAFVEFYYFLEIFDISNDVDEN